MIKKELNELLTQVGPGTPGGAMHRRYWQPIAGVSELDDNPVMPIRLLGEDLVLYRDRSGEVGLLGRFCPHRRVALTSAVPQERGLRCSYHGWLYDKEGNCLDQPAEPPESTFKDRIHQLAYPTQEMGGLIWAYLGPAPAPLLPRFDVFVWDNAWRDIAKADVPCNWLQCMENSVDPTHVDYLHGMLYDYTMQRKGKPIRPLSKRRFGGLKQVEIDVEPFKFGLKKRRRLEGMTDNKDWKQASNPVVFPNMTRAGGRGSMQIRVPIDDFNTRTFMYSCYRPQDGRPVPPQESIPVYGVELYEENGQYKTDWITGQDIMAWATQGPIMDRTQEHLGVSDKGVIAFRRMVQEQIEAVRKGRDPIGILRDPAENDVIILKAEEKPDPRVSDNHWQQWSPIYEQARALMARHLSQGDATAEGTSQPAPVG